ncbi:UEV domain-containing protein [Limtongia smithiae]|uniref:UEV domain-containing protein n=1 Tax=Limtongia smithiae TaxID=1125753 RepID=UPI0034CD43AD
MARVVSQQTLEWLHRVLVQDYRDVNRTYSDTASALQTYPSLAPRTNVHTYDTGASELLLNLHGTLPAYFRGAVYNIPVSVWVPKTYPAAAPFVFVTPTAAMNLRPGNHVDTSGKVYHPYMSYWNPGSSTLAGLCGVLCDVFGGEPPVYGKPPPTYGSSASTPPRGPTYHTPPVQQPAYTPQHAQVAYHAPAPLMPQMTGQQPAHMLSPQYTGYAPAPQHPAGAPMYAHPQPAQQPMQQQPPSQHEAPIYQQQYTGMPAQPPLPAQAYTPYQHAPTPELISLHTPPTTTPAPQYHHPVHDYLDDDTRAAPTTTSTTMSTQQLLSPPPPPLPQHPEQTRLLHEIGVVLQQKAVAAAPALQKQTEQLQATATMLARTETNLARELGELQRISDAARRNKTILRERVGLAEQRVADAARLAGADGSPGAGVNVDEIVGAEAAVFNQLYELCADDNAIEDTIYVLGKALERDRIPIDVFLKHARTLAREQFLKRALVRKIAQDTGLSASAAAAGAGTMVV